MTLTEARTLALMHMHKHGLIIEGWTFKFDNAKSRLGLCSHRRRIISVSKHYVTLNDQPLIEDTILHEIAHALCGHEAGHNWEWKATAKKIGSRGVRQKSANEVNSVKGKYAMICEKCGEIGRRHRWTRTFNVRHYTHRGCGGRVTIQ
jgi:SprT protein